VTKKPVAKKTVRGSAKGPTKPQRKTSSR
jgi:hypothetical protein